MGAPRGEYGVALVADIEVQVALTRAFQVGQTEVTRRIWQSVGWELPIQPPNPNGEYGSPCEGLDCPVPNVSFFDAVSFANKYSEDRALPTCYRLSNCTGQVGDGLNCASVELTAPTAYECEGFRLPTEAEWEYAARAGTRTAFYSGGILAQPDEDCYADANLEAIGWYCHNSEQRPHVVAEKQPNGWGLYDMSGNVSEWCNDLYDSSGYGQGPHVDPHGTQTPGPDLSQTADFSRRIIRGGSYLGWAGNAKSNRRFSGSSTGYAPSVGFRLVRTLPSP